MKTFLQTIVAAAVSVALWTTSGRAAVTAGQPAPTFQATDIQGRAVDLAAHKGRIVVLEWTNPECPFVRKHYESGNLPRLQREMAAAGVVWIAINSGREGAQGDLDDQAAAAWLREKGAQPAAYVRDQDGRIGRLFGAKATPHLFVINADGVVAYAGAIDSIRSADPSDIGRATNYVRAAVDALEAGRPVEKTGTTPYGCSVHY